VFEAISKLIRWWIADALNWLADKSWVVGRNLNRLAAWITGNSYRKERR
jgi:hypothetical protein